MGQRVLAARGLAALGLLWLAGGVFAEPGAWKHPDAAARLRISVSAPHAHQVRVDLPEALTGAVKGVAAYTADGTRVAASPIVLGDRTPSVWLALGRVPKAALQPGDEGLPLPVEVYLFQEATVPAPLGDAARRPARLTRSIRGLTTRPFTSAEALRLLGSLAGGGRPLYAFDTAGLGDTLDSSHGEGLSERRSAILLWSSALALEHPVRAAFGADSVQAAWFLFVDGRPAAEWLRAAPAEGGGFWGRPVELAAGIHTVEYLVIQGHGEALPGCLWQADGQGPQPLRGDCPATHPEAVEVQWAPDSPPAGVRLAKVSRTLFQDTGADLLCFTPLSAEGGPLPEEWAVSLDGQPWPPPQGGSCVLSAAPRLPRVEVRFRGGSGAARGISLPARAVWVPPVRAAGVCRVHELPVVLAAAETLQFEAEVSFAGEDLDERVLSRLEVIARQEDAGGKPIAETGLGQGAGRRPAAVPLAERAARVLITVRAGGIPVLPPVPIRVLHAGDDLRGLEARGRGLFQGGENAVLACRPLERVAPAHGWPGSADWQRLGILDDLCTPVEAPGASLLPEQVFGQAWGRKPALLRETVPEADRTGTLPAAARFPALARLLDLRPDAVLLVTGGPDLRSGRTAGDLCRDLLFLAQAVAASGAVPVLVALPPLPGVAPALSREAALRCKELAWRLGVPAVDAYSGERLAVLAGETFADTFVTPEGHVPLAGPNDRGREWLYGLLDRAVADLRPTRGP